MAEFHTPVLLHQAIEYLNVKAGERYLDATVGGGGHSRQILKLGGRILGLDCDPEAIEAAKRCLSSACPDASWQLARGNFTNLKVIAQAQNFIPLSGIIFDLGTSGHQLKNSQRGFSLSLDGPLDMRMDPGLSVTAADLVNGLNKGELSDLFSKLGDEPFSRQIAQAICEARQQKPIKTTRQLVEIILKIKQRKSFARLHPATLCFQALRIAVNDELNNLRKALPQALELLKPKGRLVVISFHSGEDRIVKNFLKEEAANGKLTILTKKPVCPTETEIRLNPSSRSSKLRAASKI